MGERSGEEKELLLGLCLCVNVHIVFLPRSAINALSEKRKMRRNCENKLFHSNVCKSQNTD